jgi:hypothetical protein
MSSQSFSVVCMAAATAVDDVAATASVAVDSKRIALKQGAEQVVAPVGINQAMNVGCSTRGSIFILISQCHQQSVKERARERESSTCNKLVRACYLITACDQWCKVVAIVGFAKCKVRHGLPTSDTGCNPLLKELERLVATKCYSLMDVQQQQQQQQQHQQQQCDHQHQQQHHQ